MCKTIIKIRKMFFVITITQCDKAQWTSSKLPPHTVRQSQHTAKSSTSDSFQTTLWSRKVCNCVLFIIAFKMFDTCHVSWESRDKMHISTKSLLPIINVCTLLYSACSRAACRLLAAFANAERLGNSRLEWRQIFSPKILLHRPETTEPLLWNLLFENWFF